MTSISHNDAPGDAPPQPPDDDRTNPYRGVRRLLVFASGAEPHLLHRSQTEQATFATLGGTVLATGVLAAVSVTFALSIAFQRPWYWFLPASVIWGLVIFNLDRWLVASYRRMGKWYLTAVAVLPRLALAFLFGFIISEPMILRIFASEVREQVQVITNEDVRAANEALAAGPDATAIDEVNREIASLQQRLDDLRETPATVVDSASTAVQGEIDTLVDHNNRMQAEIAAAAADYSVKQAAVTEEAANGCADVPPGQSCRPGQGPIWQQKVEEEAAARTLLESLQATNQPIINANNARINALRDELTNRRVANSSEEEQAAADRRTQIADLEGQIDRLATERSVREDALEGERRRIEDSVGDGLLDQLRALEELRDDNSHVRNFSWLLAALFIAIDCIPIIGKWLYSLGDPKPYEQIRLSVDEQAVLRHKHALDVSRLQHETVLGAVEDSERFRRAAVAANQQHFISYAAQIQRNIGNAQLAEWERLHLPPGYARVDPSILRPPPWSSDESRQGNGSDRRNGADGAAQQAANDTGRRAASESTTGHAQAASGAHDTSARPHQPGPQPEARPPGNGQYADTGEPRRPTGTQQSASGTMDDGDDDGPLAEPFIDLDKFDAQARQERLNGHGTVDDDPMNAWEEGAQER